MKMEESNATTNFFQYESLKTNKRRELVCNKTRQFFSGTFNLIIIRKICNSLTYSTILTFIRINCHLKYSKFSFSFTVAANADKFKGKS